MNRALLEKAFDTTQIRQRQGRNGLLDYVEGHTVIARLNEALEAAWSFEVVHHEVRDDEVLVLGKLSADGVTKMQFGASQVTRERGSGTAVSLGDDLKAAATDSLKKCATFLGVGLHLYADKPGGTRSPASGNGTSGPPRRPPVGAAANGRPAEPSGANGHAGGATERQLETILKIGRAKGLDPTSVEHLSLRVFNRKPAELARDEASDLIKQLSGMRRAG